MSSISSKFALFCALTAAVTCWAKDSNVCEKLDSNMGATFDVTDLVRSANSISYMITDGDIPCTKAKEKNFTYVFNVCGGIAGGIPDACRNSIEPSSGALQVNYNDLASPTDDWCYAVGDYKDGVTQLQLLDHSDPTKGVFLEYLGDKCHSTNKQRRFRIEMPCSDRLNPTPTSALELEHCVYTVQLPSVYGCPTECPVAERKLCGGNGHCHYDYDSNSAHCFCNKGYSGSNCMTTHLADEGLTYSPALMGLIVTLFIIIVLLGAGLGLMIRQVTAYRDDVANYHALKGEDDSSRGV